MSLYKVASTRLTILYQLYTLRTPETCVSDGPKLEEPCTEPGDSQRHTHLPETKLASGKLNRPNKLLLKKRDELTLPKPTRSLNQKVIEKTQVKVVEHQKSIDLLQKLVDSLATPMENTCPHPTRSAPVGEAIQQEANQRQQRCQQSTQSWLPAHPQAEADDLTCESKGA